MIRGLMGAALIALAGTASADEVITYPADTPYEDTRFALENAIIDRGLLVDHVAGVGEMLNRTGQDLGTETAIFAAAEVFMFCSASLSREVMEIDPMNIVHCPYTIFVADIDGQVVVGHRDYPDGPMQKVEDLLSDIAQEAAAGW